MKYLKLFENINFYKQISEIEFEEKKKVLFTDNSFRRIEEYLNSKNVTDIEIRSAGNQLDLISFDRYKNGYVQDDDIDYIDYSIDIFMGEDEWFLVLHTTWIKSAPPLCHYYMCDQHDGLTKLLDDTVFKN